jgi:site-specific DNA recombinase
MKPAVNSARLIPQLRAAAYLRVSSEEQVEGHSLDAQRRAIEQACAERGWTVVQWYADEGISAHTDEIAKRPAFHRMVEDAKHRRFDAIVVHKLDRFARSVVVALGTFKLLNELGITFLSLSEQGMDFTRPMGKVMFGMLALLAEYYSENLSAEIHKGKVERRAKGLHNGLVPFGYRATNGSVAEHDPQTKDGAILAFELAASDKSLREIAQSLNQRGYRTAGNMRRGSFTKDTVRDMLQNQFYLGKLPVFEPDRSRRIRSWVEGQHKPLIDEATFLAARQAMRGRAASAGARRRGSTVYSLSGLLRCSQCGERMRVTRTERGRVRYHCRNKAQGLGCTGGGSFLDVYEEQLIADLSAFELPETWKRKLIAQANEQAETPDLELQRQQLQTRLERLKELYAWGDLTRERYQRERDAIESELARLAPVEPEGSRLETFAAYLESLPLAWSDASPSQKNQLANVIYEEIWVDGPRVKYVKPRPEVEPLFQVRTGASQPILAERDELSHSMMAGATPMGFEPTISTVTGWHV